MTPPRIGAPRNPMTSIAWTTGGGKPGGSAVVPPSTTTTRRAVIIAKATAHSPQASLAAVRALTRPPWCPARMNRPLRDCPNGHHCPRYAARLLPATQRRIAARALQSPPVAHLGDHHAQDLVGAFGAIRDPARDLVEAARGGCLAAPTARPQPVEVVVGHLPAVGGQPCPDVHPAKGGRVADSRVADRDRAGGAHRRAGSSTVRVRASASRVAVRRAARGAPRGPAPATWSAATPAAARSSRTCPSRRSPPRPPAPASRPARAG